MRPRVTSCSVSRDELPTLGVLLLPMHPPREKPGSGSSGQRSAAPRLRPPRGEGVKVECMD